MDGAHAHFSFPSSGGGGMETSGEGGFADVFVPDGWVFEDEAGEHVGAFLVVEVDDVGAVFAKPVEAAGEVAAFSDDQRADLKLADEAAAIPAGGEGGDHDQVPVGMLAAGAAEGVGFTVDGRVALLDAAVVSATEQGAVFVKEGGSNGDAAFGEAEACFIEGDGKHVAVNRIFVCLQLGFLGIRPFTTPRIRHDGRMEFGWMQAGGKVAAAVDGLQLG